MYGYVYLTTNSVNGKIYVGQKKSSVFLGNKYLGSGVRLKSAIKSYGKEAFIVEMIDIAEDQEQLNEKEIYWIEYYNSTNLEIGYNISFGGGQLDGFEAWNKGTKGLTHNSEETRKKDFYRKQGEDNPGRTKEKDKRFKYW